MGEVRHDIPLFLDVAGWVGRFDRVTDEGRHLAVSPCAERILATVNLLLAPKWLMLSGDTTLMLANQGAELDQMNASGERDPEKHQSKKGQQ